MSNITFPDILRGFIKILLVAFWLFCIYLVYCIISDPDDVFSGYEQWEAGGSVYLVAVSCIAIPYITLYWQALNPHRPAPKPVRALMARAQVWKETGSARYTVYLLAKGLGIVLGFIWLLGVGYKLLVIILVAAAFALIQLLMLISGML